MLKRWLIASAMSLALSCATQAQTYKDAGGTMAQPVVPLVNCSAGGSCAGPASGVNPLPVTLDGSSSSSVGNSHAATTALASSLVIKASAGNLYSVNATAITGGSAGYLVVVNAAAAPSNGSAITPLDFCYFPAGAAGCSLSHGSIPINYSIGIVALITTATSPFTFTSGADTAAISGDYR
jgi:hypothetical protein